MELDPIVKLLGAIVAGGGSLWAIWTKALRPMLNILRTRYKNLEAIPNITKDLRLIREQLIPNGGGSLRDVVDRLESNQVLMGHKQNLLLNTSTLAMVQMNVIGQIIEVSEPLCKLLGRAKEELMNSNWLAVVHPEDRESVDDNWRSAVEDHRNFESRFRFSLIDGSDVRVFMNVKPTLDTRGRSQGFLGTITKV